jgi:hypothetical protein
MYQANPRFKKRWGKGVEARGPHIRSRSGTRKRNLHCRRKPVKEPGSPTSRVGPRRLIRVKAEAWLPAARAKSGPRLPGHWTGAEGALAADVRAYLVWLGPFTHATARSESCPPREALGARCVDPVCSYWACGGGARSGGAWDRRGAVLPGVRMVFARPCT